MKKLTRKEAVMRKALLISSLGLLCLLLAMWGCERHTTGAGGGGGSGTVASLSITAGDTELATPAGVVDSTLITVTVTDGGGSGVPGKQVELWMDTNVGVLTALSDDDTTDFGGQVTTVFRVNSNFGSNTIHARVEGVTAELGITVREVNITQVTLQVAPAVLSVAPGSSGQATLKVWVRDNDGNGVAHVKPSLTSLKGIIENYGRTDNTGKVETNFFSAGDYGEAEIIAGVGAISDTAMITINETASATGIIDVQSDLYVIYADGGVTTANVTALLKDADYQVIQNDTVIFTSDAGAISSPAITDSLGIAHTSFTDVLIATEPDSATIIAQYRPFGIADTIYIMILEQQPISHITLSVNPNTLLAGVDSAEVTATVIQLNGEFAPEGTQVIFESDSGGSFEPSNVGIVNEAGQASLYFYAPNATGIYTLTATASAVVSNEVAVNVEPGPVRHLDVTVDPPYLYTSSTQNALVTVEVTDSLGNYVEDGVLIFLETTLGIVTPTAYTQSGIATGILNPGNTAGLATVKAYYGFYADSTTVEFIAGGPSTITLESDRNFIQVQGVGGPEQALLTARVKDAMSNPIEDGWPVIFIIENNGSPGGGININNQGITDTVFTINGSAIATLNAGVNSGPVLIKAWTYTDTTQSTIIFARKSGINVASGPPEVVMVGHNSEGVDAGAGSWSIDVHASVADAYANPVDDSIAVFFTVVPDTADINNEGVFTGNEPFSGGDPVAGNAYTVLTYNGAATFEEVTVTAECAVLGQGTIEGSETFQLPLQGCEITLYIQPAAWHYNSLGDPAEFECRAYVQDGHGQPINNALVLFFTTKGRFYLTQSGVVEQDEKLTGQPPDPPGQATLWIIAYMANVFLDPITPEVTGTVSDSVYGYPECITDGQQIILQRIPEGD